MYGWKRYFARETVIIYAIPHFLLYGKNDKLMQYKAERPAIGVPLKDRLNQLK